MARPNLVVSSLHVWFKNQMQLSLTRHLNSVSSLRYRDKAWCLQPQNVSWTCQDTTHGITEIEKDAVQEFRCFFLAWRCCWFRSNSADRTDVHKPTETLDNEVRHRCDVWQLGPWSETCFVRLTSHCLGGVGIGMPLCPWGTYVLSAAY